MNSTYNFIYMHYACIVHTAIYHGSLEGFNEFGHGGHPASSAQAWQTQKQREQRPGPEASCLILASLNPDILFCGEYVSQRGSRQNHVLLLCQSGACSIWTKQPVYTFPLSDLEGMMQ